MTENWRPVVGYEGSYEVSDAGRVRSVERRIVQRNGHPLTVRPRVLRQYDAGTGRTGHRRVRLLQAGKGRSLWVHRLVLLAFVGPPPGGTEACHNDGDPTNNRLENLRWDTRRENALDIVRAGEHHEASKTHCKHGHEFTPENTRYVGPRKWRHCRTCNRERVAAGRRQRALA